MKTDAATEHCSHWKILVSSSKIESYVLVMYQKKKNQEITSVGPVHFIVEIYHEQLAFLKYKIENGSYSEVHHSCRQNKRINIYAKA